MGCRLAGWDGVLSTAILRIISVHAGGATADTLGAATSLTAFLCLNLTGWGTSIDSYSALSCLKLARSSFIRRYGVSLIERLCLLRLHALSLAVETLILRLRCVAEIVVSSLHQSALTYGVHFLESLMAEGALL